MAVNPQPFWQQAQFYVTIMLLAPIYFTVYKVVEDTTGHYSDTVQVMVITAVMSSALGAIVGFWMGQSARQAPTTPPVTDPLAGVIPAGTPGDPVSTKEVTK